jgi:hypothetical protein
VKVKATLASAEVSAGVVAKADQKIFFTMDKNGLVHKKLNPILLSLK